MFELGTPTAPNPCSSEAPSSAPLWDLCIWGGWLSRYFWEYLHPSLILAFIVDIPRTVKQDKCPISRATVGLPPLAVNSILPTAQGREEGRGSGPWGGGASCRRERKPFDRTGSHLALQGLWSWHCPPHVTVPACVTWGPGSLCAPARGQTAALVTATLAPVLLPLTSVSFSVRQGGPLVCVAGAP